MEILQFLFIFLLDEYGGKELEPLLDTFRENDFDIKKSLSQISPKDLVPIIKFFLGYGDKNKSHPPKNECDNKLVVIKSIANDTIYNCFSDYFSNSN